MIFLFLIIHQIVFAQNGKEEIKVTDMLKIRKVGDISLANDGSKVVYSVTSIEPDGDAKWEYKYVTQLYMAATDGSQTKQITFNKDGASQPIFSPDGKQLAFVRTVDAKPQIFVLSMEGGEPIQLTKSKYGASNPKWSPDGKQLLFTGTITLKELLTDSVLNPQKEMPQWLYEKPGFSGNENLKISMAKADPDGSIEEIRNYLGNNEKDKKAKVLNKLHFQNEYTTTAEVDLSQIFILDMANDSQPKALTHHFYSCKNPSFTKDGKQIVFETSSTENNSMNREWDSEIWIMNSDGSAPRKIIGKPNMNYREATISPSGKWLAFESSKIEASTESVFFAKLILMPLNGTEKDMITISWDRDKSSLKWSDDGNFLYFISKQNGGSVICRLDIKTKIVTTLTDSNSGVLSMDLHNNRIVFTKTEVANPSELFAANTEIKNVVQLSSLNTDWLKSKKLSFPEKKTFVNNKGMTVEYWVMKPTQYEQGKKYPLLLEMHGGPAAMWGPGEISMWHEFQFFCAKGYGVVYCNPRGSTGYGDAFLRDNIKDFGDGPMSDVMHALDETVAQGWADTSKLLITGGSYAGYLTTWIISHDHRFRAACTQRGVYDFRTFFGEGRAWQLIGQYYGGHPWEVSAKEILEKQSPINYVQNITTPLIIFHGENDLRTGVSQSEELYRSLKVLGRPVEYVRHPGATHEITRSGNNRQRIDQMLRTYEFFERFIK